MESNLKRMSSCRWKFAVIFFILDFLLQNTIMTLIFFYYFTQPFVNKPAKNAYLAFLIIYVLLTVVPKLWIITFDKIFKDKFNKAYLCFGKLLYLFLTMIQGEYIWIILTY